MRRAAVGMALALLALVGARGLILHSPWNWPRDALLAALATIPGWIKTLAWLFALLAPAGIAAAAWREARRGRSLEARARDGGKTVLHPAMLEAVIAECLADWPEIDPIGVRARVRRKGLAIELRARVRRLEGLPALEERVRERIQAAMRSILGLESLERIDLRFEGLRRSERAEGAEGRQPPIAPAPRAPLADAEGGEIRADSGARDAE
ncbi:MAG: hypothetical protein BWZ10_01972 [candidate division BRC1 bacterium ADurb.BinA364]|nr:MAG: hypothetical protein BWZ10_01972 [candidate division BRC1 bacterium ADurb.BinA364]